MVRARRHPVRVAAVVVAGILAVVIVIGWITVGPPAGPIPRWVRWTLPYDISTMKVSSGAHYALLSYPDKSVVLDLSTGRSGQYDEGVGATDLNRTFITDAGISGYVDDGVAAGYDRNGKRLWRRDLATFEHPELIAFSEHTAVIDDRCDSGEQRVIGIDLRTGRDSWRKTIASCRWHVYRLPSHSLISVPAGRNGDGRALNGIDDDKTFATVTGSGWTVRGDLLLRTDAQGEATATGYPRHTVRWTTRVCPDSAGRTTIGHAGDDEAGDTAPVVATCGDSSTRIVDVSSGRSAVLPKGIDVSTVQSTSAGLISVQHNHGKILGTDLLTGKSLWQRSAPVGDIDIQTTPTYAVISDNHDSHNTFMVLDLTTGKQHAHSPAWGDWWVGQAGTEGVWVTHRSFCEEPYDCKVHTTYLIG